MAGRLHDGFLPGRHLLDAYGNGGFRFGDMSHRGSILILPSGIRAWDALAPSDFSEAAFAPLFAEAAEIDIILLGTGIDPVPLADALRWRFKDHGLSVDVMATGTAARTYNVLAAENRKVAAALLAVP